MSEPDPVAPDVTTAGELLRAAREQQGVHVAVLAAALKVAPRKLELLESNRVDELPDPTFARALALSMCRALKIDPEPVLLRLPQPHSHKFETMAGGLNQPFRDRDPGGDGIEWRRFLTLPILAAAALVVGAIVIYLAPARLPSTEQLSLPAASAPLGALAEAPVASVPAAPVPTAPQVSAPPATAQAEASAPLVAAESAAPASAPVDAVAAAAPVDAASAAGGARLNLRAEAVSWVQVRDRDNNILLSRTMAAGETTALDGTPPLRLVVGNARGTRVEFRGQPVSLSDATKGNVARLELP
jgi:cytoskeleton protein RodZ